MNKPMVLSLSRCAAGALAVVAAGSASAAIVSYQANLSGPAEAPPNASPATGFGQLDYDDATHMMHIQVSFSGLLAGNTACHIHAATALAGAGTAPVATPTPTFPGFPSGVTSGTFDATFDMSLLSSYRAGFVTANGGTAASAEAALFASIAAGTSYLNIHTSVFPGGEIRGFWFAVPTPASGAMLGLAGLMAARRRR